MARKPAYDMVEIPNGKHPAWQDVDNRAAFEEDMRLHLYDAIDNLSLTQLPEEERLHWEGVITALAKLGMYYKSKGFPMIEH